MSVGFSFAGFQVGAGSSSGNSGSIGNTFSETFSSTKRQTSIFNFGDGTVWQWTFVVEDQCGKSTVRTQFVGRTNGVPEKPCCLPGFSAQFDKLHGPPTSDGPCHGSTPLASYCGGPTSPPTPAPTPAPTPKPPRFCFRIGTNKYECEKYRYRCRWSPLGNFCEPRDLDDKQRNGTNIV